MRGQVTVFVDDQERIDAFDRRSESNERRIVGVHIGDLSIQFSNRSDEEIERSIFRLRDALNGLLGIVA